jgi:hypothetical protein
MKPSGIADATSAATNWARACPCECNNLNPISHGHYCGKKSLLFKIRTSFPRKPGKQKDLLIQKYSSLHFDEQSTEVQSPLFVC